MLPGHGPAPAKAIRLGLEPDRGHVFVVPVSLAVELFEELVVVLEELVIVIEFVFERIDAGFERVEPGKNFIDVRGASVFHGGIGCRVWL